MTTKDYNQLVRLQRASKAVYMIEAASTIILSLQHDLMNYDNLDTRYETTRLLLERDWILATIEKYTRIRERLAAWYKDIMKGASPKAQMVAYITTRQKTTYTA